MSQCETMMLQGHQCIYPVGHSGEHYAPMDGLDHSDDIRIKVLRDAVAELEARITTVRRDTALRCRDIALESGNAWSASSVAQLCDQVGHRAADSIAKEFGL